MNPVLDGFPELVDIAKKVASHEVAEYALGGVRLPVDLYLDAMQMMARDGSNPAEVIDPPSRVRTALGRKRRRAEQLERQRQIPLSESDADERAEPEQLEAEVMAKVDLEHGKARVGMSEDQSRAVEARMSGVNLQGAEAGDELGWDAARLQAVRRSLASDRPCGRKLRRHFAAYKKAP